MSSDGSERPHVAQSMSGQSSDSPALKHEVLFRCTTTNARVCKLALPHYTCDTPMFMPVGTCGAVKGMTTEELEDLDCHLILGNTYHLALRPGTGSRAGIFGSEIKKSFFIFPRAFERCRGPAFFHELEARHAYRSLHKDSH